MSLVKLLPAWLHAVADYAVGVSLIIIALAVGGASKAVLPGVVVGAVVLVVSPLTKYPLGAIKVLPFTVHSAGDYLAAVLLIASPFALGFFDSARGLSIVYLVEGVAVLGVSLITNYQYGPAAKSTSRAAADGWAPPPAASRPRPSYAPAGENWREAAEAQPSYAPAGQNWRETAEAPAAPAAQNGQRVMSLREAIALKREAS